MAKKPNQEDTKLRTTRAVVNKERIARKLEREALKEAKREKTPRGEARKKRRRAIQALYYQEEQYRKRPNATVVD